MGKKFVNILGVKVSTLSKEEILEEIKKYLEKLTTYNSQLTTQEVKPLVIFTPNPEIIVYAHKDEKFRQILNQADLCLPDGWGVVWASQILKFTVHSSQFTEIKERVSGIEFMEDLCQLAAEQGFRVGLIGGREGVALRSLECLQRQFPNLKGWADAGPQFKVQDSRFKVQSTSDGGRAEGEDSSEVEEIEIKSAEDLIETTKKHLGEEIILEIERCEKGVQCLVLSVKLTPRKEYPAGEGPMGVVISNYEERTYPWYQAPFLGTKEAFSLSWLLFKGIAQTLWKLISFQPVGKEVAGPVGIAQLTGEAVKFGKMAILELLGLLSLNLAIINILPFPALDGGRLLFVGIEALTGKKVRPKWERWTHQVGMAILLAFFVLITINDIIRIIGK